MSSKLPGPDMSLLLKSAYDDGKPIPPPHLAHFQKNGKHLYFVGTRHDTDTETRSHGIAYQAFKHKPQCVIVEGSETSEGWSPIAVDKKHPNFKRYYAINGEPVHAAEFARDQGIPFIGGEPSSKDIFKALAAQGVSEKETTAYLLLTMIPQWRPKGLIPDKAHFAKQANAYLENDSRLKHISKEQRLKLEEFDAWYDAHKAEIGNKDILAVTEQDCHPVSLKNPNHFQKISLTREELRNQNLISLAAEALKQYDRVLVVYGGAHLKVTAPVFEQMFGGKAVEEHLMLTQTNPPIPAAPPVIQADIAITSTSKPGALPGLLKRAGVVLLAVAAIAAVASAPMLMTALLASSVLAFASSKIVEADQQKPPVFTTQTVTARMPAVASPGLAMAQGLERSDGKSWAESAVTKPLSRSV